MSSTRDPGDKGSNLPGISGVFTSTSSGLRRRRRQSPASIDPDAAPPIQPLAEATTQDLEGTTEEVDAGDGAATGPGRDAAETPPPPATPDGGTSGAEDPSVPASGPPRDAPPIPEGGIQLSGGLQPVDTAEIRIPPEMARRAAEMAPPAGSTTGVPAAPTASSPPRPMPAAARPIEVSSARHHDPQSVAPSLLHDEPQSARVGSGSGSVGLVVVGVVLVVTAVVALVYVAGRMTGMF